MGKVKNMNQIKNVFQSKIMLGMIITLLVSFLCLLVMAVIMFVFAAVSENVYFSFGLDDVPYETKLNQSKLLITAIAVADICIAAVKITELCATYSIYKKYPKSTGFNIIKITSIVMSVICSLIFAFLFVGAFISAVQSGEGYKLASFRAMMLPAIIMFFPTLKFISLSVTVSSIKKQVTNGVLLLMISTAVLTAGYFIVATDIIINITKYYGIISINMALILVVFGVVDLFIFIMTNRYMKIQIDEYRLQKKN